MAQVKKLSVATVYGSIDIKALIRADEDPENGAVKGDDGKFSGGKLKLMRVYGQAVSTKTGASSYGDWTSLLGQFKAVNLATGEVHEASTLFLPDVAMTAVMVGLSAPDARSVEFAMDIFATLRKDGKPGGVPYTYEWAPILPPGENDPIKRLEAKMLALAAPAPAEALKDDPAPADKGHGRGRSK